MLMDEGAKQYFKSVLHDDDGPDAELSENDVRKLILDTNQRQTRSKRKRTEMRPPR